MRRFLFVFCIFASLPAYGQDARLIAAAHGVHIYGARTYARHLNKIAVIKQPSSQITPSSGSDPYAVAPKDWNAEKVAEAKPSSAQSNSPASNEIPATSPISTVSATMTGVNGDSTKIDLTEAGFEILHPNRMGKPELPDDLRSLLPGGVGPTPTTHEEAPVITSQPAPPLQYLNDTSDQGACLRNIDEAEQYFGIPHGILRAISYVESGYGGSPWPWTLNINGQAHYFPNARAAIVSMGDSRGYLIPNMAVGCVQLYVRYHGQRFRNAAHMIDPRTNVFYGGYYLRELFDKYHDWTQAVGRYHSSQAYYQNEYLCRVVSFRMRQGNQTPNAWYAHTCPGGMQTYVAWARAGQ